MLPTLPSGYVARAVKPSDSKTLIKLVETCFHEYEGAYIDLADLDSDLLDYAAHLEKSGGAGIVVEQGGAVVGTIACSPVGGGTDGQVFELKRLYIYAENRGGGLASAMLAYIEEVAKSMGGTEMVLWTDTRFERAHRFYAREGYTQTGETRDLHDISNTTEYEFRKPLSN